MKKNRNLLSSFAPTFFAFLASNTFLYIVLGVFIVQAIWAALSLQYPMAFDENYHYGIIQVYARQWGPFISEQPAHSGHLGELPYLPSFLFHYLMSFPYRLIHLFTANDTVIIVILRFINIALFAGGLYYFRKFFDALKVPRAISQLSLFFLVLIPSVILLGGEINYDNLLFLLTPLFFLYTLYLARDIREHAALSFTNTVLFISIGSLAGIVKYPFLPIFLGAALGLFVLWAWSAKHWEMLRHLGTSFRETALSVRLLLIGLLIISAGLFTYRYTTNIIVFHDIDPDCAKALSVEECIEYGPWGRDYKTRQNNLANGVVVQPDLVYFERGWYEGMIHRLYFAIKHTYENDGALPIQTRLVYTVATFGSLAALLFWRSISRRIRYLWIYLLITLVYVASLQYINFTTYAELGGLVAINGRYLIPVLPIIFVIIALGLSAAVSALGGRHARTIKMLVILAATFVSLFGAGMISYLVYADSSWYWQWSPFIHINEWLRMILRPLMIGGL